jgi:hypothetical protein
VVRCGGNNPFNFLFFANITQTAPPNKQYTEVGGRNLPKLEEDIEFMVIKLTEEMNNELHSPLRIDFTPNGMVRKRYYEKRYSGKEVYETYDFSQGHDNLFPVAELVTKGYLDTLIISQAGNEFYQAMKEEGKTVY